MHQKVKDNIACFSISIHPSRQGFVVEILVRIKEKYWHFYRGCGIVSVYMKNMKKWENTYVGDILCPPW